MKNGLFWRQDWFVGILVSLFFLLVSSSDLIQSLERKAYDLGVRASSRTPSDKIAVIAIDDQSIANLGRWPWPRAIHARMIDILNAGHAKVIGETVFFFEPQLDPGLSYLNKIAEVLASSSVHQNSDTVALNKVLQDALQNLNNDQKLGDSMAKANNVLLASYFDFGEMQGKPDHALADFMARDQLTHVQTSSAVTPRLLLTKGVQIPLTVFGDKAMAIGHLNNITDVDGAVRAEPLLVSYLDDYYPSLSLMLAAKSLNLDAKDVVVTPGGGVSLGKQQITTDASMQMRSFFYADRAGHTAFPVDSFYDVYSGKISPEKYKDKIVLIGASAAGVGSMQVTPISPAMAPVLVLAHSVSSILQGDYFVTPSWASLAEIAIFVLVAAYLIFGLPRLNAKMGALVTSVSIAVLLVAHFVLMTVQAMWLQLMLPVLLLFVGHTLLTTKRYFLTEKIKQKSEANSAESNRMLALAFQNQGQLDMAFDIFRKVPLDNTLMAALYTLGLDFERKRQFNKAESVFQYMADFNPQFRDIAQRAVSSHNLAETLIMGTANMNMGLGGAGVSRPMLGRYEIEKELGKGAMGAVYLGKDPKIGRVVAIKTVELTTEFEEDEWEDVRERFFREAETAGRLMHPNIVLIYDVGEEHDLAYIAMEFLKGKDMVQYTRADHLLPLDKVMSIVARVADALDYAHRQNVVHRDIKPANIMYDAESDTVKVTDFGIARLTDSSKTKTGLVLGTPSFMSPEQLAGKKIEGVSDLFSLGVTLYQLACGKLPFEGDSMAQLMYKIANDPPVDILMINPAVPPCLTAIINKMLNKKIEERYASGTQVAEALRLCALGAQGLK